MRNLKAYITKQAHQISFSEFIIFNFQPDTRYINISNVEITLNVNNELCIQTIITSVKYWIIYWNWFKIQITVLECRLLWLLWVSLVWPAILLIWIEVNIRFCYHSKTLDLVGHLLKQMDFLIILNANTTCFI